MMTDMVDFSAVSERIGAERVYGLMRYVMGMAETAIKDHGGHVIDTAGDGVLAAFGAPIALEHGSLHACKAAVAFQSALADAAEHLERDFGIAPAFRTGISGGEVVFGQIGIGDKVDFKVMGEPVNLAARLEALAAAGEILLSDSVLLQVEGFVLVTEIGNHSFKGFREKQPVFRLDAIPEAPSRFDGQKRRGIVDLISRKTELDQLIAIAGEATASPRFVTVCGPAGIGKSRLIHEFVTREGIEGRALLGQCNPSTIQIPFLPLVEVLANRLDLVPQSSAAEFQARIAQHLGIDVSIEELTGLLPRGIGAAHSERRPDLALEIRQTMKNLIVAAAQDHTIVIEDAHWIDSISAELLDQISRRETGSGRVIVVVTHRPEFEADWLHLPTTTVLTLKPLTPEDIRTLVRNRFGDIGISDAIVELVVDRSEGNPLFAEEIVRFLIAADVLVKEDEVLDLDERADEKLLTGNLQQMIQSRFDKLPEPQKPLLQLASAMGRNFSADLIAKASPDGAPVQAMCRRALVEGLIEEGPSTDANHWRFSHALMRDAIYGGMLQDRRSETHRIIAETIIAENPDTLNDHAETLSYHYSAAKDARNAVKYLAMAAEKSYRIYAVAQLEEQMAAAFAFIEADPPCVDDAAYGRILVTWLRAMEQSGNFSRVLALAEKYLPRLSAEGYNRDHAIATILCAIARTHTRDYTGALDTVTEIMAEAEQKGDEVSVAWAKVALMRIYDETAIGEATSVQTLADEVRPIAEKHGDTHMSMMALYILSANYRTLGKLKKSLDVAQQISDFAEIHGDRRAFSYSCWARGLVYSLAGNYQESLRLAEVGLENSLPGSADKNVNLIIWATAMMNLGRPDDAINILDPLIETCEKYEDYNIVHVTSLMRIQAMFRRGQIFAAWQKLKRIEPVIKQAGQVNIIRYLSVFRGEILMALTGLSPRDPNQESPERPKLKLIDIATVIYLRVFGRKQAQRDFEEYLRTERMPDGAGVARALINLGIVSKRNRPSGEIRAMIEKGREFALAEQVAPLVRRADLALDALKAR